MSNFRVSKIIEAQVKEDVREQIKRTIEVLRATGLTNSEIRYYIETEVGVWLQ